MSFSSCCSRQADKLAIRLLPLASDQTQITTECYMYEQAQFTTLSIIMHFLMESTFSIFWKPVSCHNRLDAPVTSSFCHAVVPFLKSLKNASLDFRFFVSVIAHDMVFVFLKSCVCICNWLGGILMSWKMCVSICTWLEFCISWKVCVCICSWLGICISWKVCTALVSRNMKDAAKCTERIWSLINGNVHLVHFIVEHWNVQVLHYQWRSPPSLHYYTTL